MKVAPEPNPGLLAPAAAWTGPRRGRGPRRRGPWPALLLVTGMIATAALGVVTTAVAAPATSFPLAAPSTTQPLVDLLMTEFAPAIGRPDDVLQLRGTIRNRSDAALADVQAILRLSTEPLTSRADIRRVAAEPQFRAGIRDTQTFAEIGAISAGSTAGFALRVPMARLGLPASGVYVVGVDVRATRPDRSRGTVGIARTVLPWLAGADPEPVGVAVVLPLVAAPTLLPDGTLTGNALSDELAPTGPLGGRLSAGSGRPIDWAVDPDLLETAALLAEDHRVRGADGTAVDEPADDHAVEWLRQFRQLAGLPPAGGTDPAQPSSDPAPTDAAGAGRGLGAPGTVGLVAAPGIGRAPAPESRLWRLPTGNVDVAALGALSERRWALDRLSHALAPPSSTPEQLGPGVDLLVVPVGFGLGARGAALLDAVVAADPPKVAVGDVGLRLAATATDPGLSPAVATRQRLLAETYLAAAQSAEAGGVSLTLAPTSTWTGGGRETTLILDTLQGAPWVRLRPLAQIPAPSAARIASNPGKPLAQRQISGALQMHRQVAATTAVLSDPQPLVQAFEGATLRALSSAWRLDPATGLGYLDAVRGQFGTGVGVTVLVPDSVTLSARTGRFPLTVVNALAAEAVVRLELVPANRARLQIDQPEPIILAAGEKATVTVSATAAANGRVPVLVQLRTAGGESVGPGQTMLVVATRYGTIGWVLVAGGAALLFATSARRILRRVRGGAEPVPGSSGGALSAPSGLRGPRATE